MLTIYQTIPGSEKFTSDVNVKDLYGTWVLLFKDTIQIIKNDSILMAFLVISLPDIAHVENVGFLITSQLQGWYSNQDLEALKNPWVKMAKHVQMRKGTPGSQSEFKQFQFSISWYLENQKLEPISRIQKTSKKRIPF